MGEQVGELLRGLLDLGAAGQGSLSPEKVLPHSHIRVIRVI